MENHRKSLTSQEFRDKLGWTLIDNDFISIDTLPGSGRTKRRSIIGHVLATAPLRAKKLSTENGMFPINVNTSNISTKRLDANKNTNLLCS